MRYRIVPVVVLSFLAIGCNPTAHAAIAKENGATARAPAVDGATGAKLTQRSDSNREATTGIRSSYFDCTAGHEGEILEVGYCITEEREYQVKRLNASYQALTRTLTPDQTERLAVSQRAWLAFNDKESELQSAVYGSDQASNLQIGEHELLRLCDRANQLKSYLDLIED